MILVIDNYDSFTWNLVHYLQELGVAVKVVRNDEISVDQALAMRPQGYLISPGPCTPNEAGISLDLVKACAAERLPLLGVCADRRGHTSRVPRARRRTGRQRSHAGWRRRAVHRRSATPSPTARLDGAVPGARRIVGHAASASASGPRRADGPRPPRARPDGTEGARVRSPCWRRVSPGRGAAVPPPAALSHSRRGRASAPSGTRTASASSSGARARRRYARAPATRYRCSPTRTT